MKIMNEVSYLGAHDDEINTRRRSTIPELFKYPIAYIIEVELVDDDRPRGRGAARVHAEGRLRHRRRLQGDRRLRQPAAAGSRSRRT